MSNLYLYLVLSLFALSANANELGNKIKIVEVEYVKRQDFFEKIQLIGIVKSENNVSIKAEGNYILEKIYALTGRKIKKGDIIASFVGYDILNESANIAKEQFDRVDKLNKQNLLAKNVSDDKKKEWLKQKQEANKSIIRAYNDGIVGIYKVNAGDTVKSGDEIVTISSNNSKYVELNIPEYILPKMKIGQELYIKDQKYNLSQIQFIIDPETYSAPARASIDCDNCYINSLVDVKLITDIHRNSLVIPQNAIFLKDNQKKVYVVKDNRIILRSITTDLRDDTLIEITSGLSEGEAIIATGQSRVFENEEVKIYDK